jgi:hypothetical protein
MSNHSFSVTPTELKQLGSYLVEAGLLSQVQIDVALADQAATGVRFGDILVLRSWIKEQTIEYFMRKIILPEREAVPKSLAHTEGQQPAKRSPTVGQRSTVAKQKLFGTFRDRDTEGWMG